jgi:hypothetical protein
MDRLALVEARLNSRTVSAVEVSIVQDTVPTVPDFVPIDMVGRISEEQEEEEEYEYEMEKMKRMETVDSKKTDESRSMV